MYLHPFHLPFQSNVNDVSCKISVEWLGAFAVRVTSCDPQFFPLKRAYSGLRLWRCLSVNCCFSFTNEPKKISNTYNVQHVITPIQRTGGLRSVRSPIAQTQNQDEPDEYLAQRPVWLTILKLFRISQLRGITHFDQLNRKERFESLTWRFIYPSVLTKNPRYSNPHFKRTNTGLPVSSWRNGLGLTGPTCWCFFFINENYQPVFGRRVDTHSSHVLNESTGGASEFEMRPKTWCLFDLRPFSAFHPWHGPCQTAKDTKKREIWWLNVA